MENIFTLQNKLNTIRNIYTTFSDYEEHFQTTKQISHNS